MTIPKQTTTVKENATGLAVSDVAEKFAYVGVSSAGVAGVIYAFSDPQTVIDTLGEGPLVEELTWTLSKKRGIVYAAKVVSDVAAAIGAVTETGTGPAITATGTPYNSEEWKVRFTKAGALGVALFQYSRDGGDTWSGEIVAAATYPVPNTNVTLNFAAGSYAIDKTAAFNTTEPSFSTSALNTALDVIRGDGSKVWSVVKVNGIPQGADDTAKSAAAAGIAGALDAKLATMFTTHRFARGIFDGPDIANDATADALLIAAITAVVAKRTGFIADFAEIRSPISGGVFKRPASWVGTHRLREIGISTDPAEVELGPLPVEGIRRDENVRPGFDDARIGTLATITGLTGFFIGNMKFLHAVGSDIVFFQHGRLIDEACRINRAYMVSKLSKGVGTKDDGTIAEVDAKMLESGGNDALRPMVVAKHVTRAFTTIVRTDNLQAVGAKLRNRVRIRPKGYLKDIESEVGFEPNTPGT